MGKVSLLHKMERLQENVILKTLAKWMTPTWILGVLGLFSPFVYAILPVHEADICLCEFFK